MNSYVVKKIYQIKLKSNNGVMFDSKMDGEEEILGFRMKIDGFLG